MIDRSAQEVSMQDVDAACLRTAALIKIGAYGAAAVNKVKRKVEAEARGNVAAPVSEAVPLIVMREVKCVKHILSQTCSDLCLNL